MGLDNYFNIFLLLGALLSMLLALYLFFYPSRFYANKVLGLLAFSWAVTDFAFIIQSPDFFSRYPHLYGVFDIFTLLFFPLMYVYLRTYLYVDARKISKNIIHVIPALLYTVLSSPFFIQNREIKLTMILEEMPLWFDLLTLVFNLVIIGQGIFYTILSLRELHHFQYFRKSRLTWYQLNSLKWLRLFVIVNINLWLIGTAGVILEILNIKFVIDLFEVFYLGLSILTLVLGIFTISRTEFFSEEEDIVKYANNYLRTANSQAAVSKSLNDVDLLLNYLKKDKPYLKTDLSMQDLVVATGLSYKRISEIFNTELKKSFFEVINEYRMESALELINNGFYKQHTLPHLAEEAGFNSKTTFNRIFKKYTGQTPTEYIQSREL